MDRTSVKWFRWPVGLIVYLIVLQIRSIALNWYGSLYRKSMDMC